MLRRIIAAVLCIGVFAGAVATAEAAFRAGTYTGKTEQNAKISLKVLKNKKALIKFYWEGAVMGCSDGENRQIAGFRTPTSEKIPIKKSGRFKLSASASDGSVEFVTEGRIKGKRAKGALQVQARAEQEDGSVLTCDSEIVEWSAKRK